MDNYANFRSMSEQRNRTADYRFNRFTMRYSGLDVFKKPMCLVESSGNGPLTIHENVLNEIATINTPIVVVAIAGLYRTGKSYLMNRLAQEKIGFPTGKSIQATTKGIWVWCKEHPTQPNTTLLLMDTEGLGDVQKINTNHDNKLFTLALLQCRVLCYNQMRALDDDTVKNIALISKLAGEIYANCYHALSLSAPELVVCLRDFVLDLTLNGSVITEDDYLENSLRHSGQEVKKLFSVRRCFSFEAPGTRSIVNNLERTIDEDLPQEFLDDIKTFTTYIYSVQPAVMPDKTPINGSAFSTLLKCFVEQFQRGGIPDIPSTLGRWKEQIRKKTIETIVDKYTKNLNSTMFPVLSTIDFNLKCEKEQQNALLEVRNNISGDEWGVAEHQVKVSLQKRVDEIKEKNDDACYVYWEKTITEDYNRKIGSKTWYFYLGGYQRYINKLASFHKSWKQQHPYEAQREKAFSAFTDTKAVDKDTILKECNKIQQRKAQESMRIIKEKQRHEAEERIQENQRKIEEYRAEEDRKREKRLMEERQREEARIQDLERRQQEQVEYMHRQQRQFQREMLQGQLDRALMTGRASVYFCLISFKYFIVVPEDMYTNIVQYINNN